MKIKIQPRQIFLLSLMCIVGFFFLREYLGKFQLPTDALIKSRLVELQSARADLKYAKQLQKEQKQNFAELNALAASYWIPTSSAKLEQEINAEISKILRRSQVQATQKVDTTHERAGSFLQEVSVTLEMKSVSMQSVVRFFREFSQYRNARKFTWENCKIGPDNSRSPKGVNVSLKFKVMALNDDALKLINGEK